MIGKNIDFFWQYHYIFSSELMNHSFALLLEMKNHNS